MELSPIDQWGSVTCPKSFSTSVMGPELYPGSLAPRLSFEPSSALVLLGDFDTRQDLSLAWLQHSCP